MQRWAFIVVAAVTLALPLVIDMHGEDTFRLPKEVVFRGGAIAVAVVMLFALTSGELRLTRPSLRRFAFILPALCVAWALVTTAVSTNRLLSLEAMITVTASAVLFYGIVWAVGSESILALDFVLVPAMVNSILVVLQEYGIWQPFRFPPEAAGHVGSSALIGNPNDVGAYLVVPAVAAAVGTAAARGWRRFFYSFAALVLLGGLIASSTRTALLAYLAALAVFGAMRSLRNLVIIAILVGVLLGVVLSPLTPLGQNVRTAVSAARAGRYNAMLSDRLSPYLAAYEMFKDHPLVGVGPGCYKAHEMPYRIALLRKYPPAWITSSTQRWSTMFGEVHNDHLQLLAEAGAPAYLILLTALGLIAIPGFKRLGWHDVQAQLDAAPPAHANHATPTRRFAHELRVPLTVAILVTMLGQFPLQIAAPRLMFLYFAALCVAWDRHAA